MTRSPETEACRAQTRIAYGLHYLLGVGLLTPWNAFVTASDYFELRFPVGVCKQLLLSLCSQCKLTLLW